jgi:uncharacterized protein DUF4136
MTTKTFAVIATVTLLGAVTFAQNVTYDFDKATNFQKYKTYTWIRGTSVNDELVHKRIVHSIDAQLASKGLAMVDASASPDVLVAYHANFDTALQINASSSGWGPYGFGGNRFGSARASEIAVGTLTVDIIDAKTKTIVWRGVASKDVDGKASPEKKDKNMNKTAQKMFRNYPPKN